MPSCTAGDLRGGSGVELPLCIISNAPNPCAIKFRAGICFVCQLGFGMEAVLPRLELEHYSTS